MAWRFHVIDGADTGRFFPLPEKGTVLIGNSRKHADIHLNDLYVARVHCQVDVAEGKIVVAQIDTAHDTMLNGQKIRQHGMKAEDVLRVGNSHLRLEECEAPPPTSEPGKSGVHAGRLPQVSGDQLEDLAEHTLAHYQLERVIGRGNFGVVFHAQDVKNNRVVALKVLSPEFPKNDAEMQNFVRVFKAVLPLRHPQLVTVYGAGKTGPYTWIAREFVEGESLALSIVRLKEARRIDWTVALQVGLDIGHALEFIHGHHLMHGNITPENILFDIDAERAKLADLQFTKALEGSTLFEATLEKKVAAEAAYLAPEQTIPGAFVDNLCDIYGLGAVTYALLTGQPPFIGDGPEDVLAQVREAPPDRPRKYQKSIPAEMERIVMKMLAKRQEERYATPAELLADLQPLVPEEEEEDEDE